MANNNSSPDSGGQRARGKFPRLSLKSAKVLPEAVFNVGHGEPVPRAAVFRSMGRAAASGSAATLVAAATSGYGLVQVKRTGNLFELTEFGRQLVSANDTASSLKAAYTILQSNEIFSGFLKRYADHPLPIEDVAVPYLVNEHKLSDLDAKACYAVIKANLEDFDLTQDDRGRTFINTPQAVLAKMGTSEPDDVNQPASGEAGDQTLVATPSVSSLIPNSTVRGNGAVQPQIAFNIQIVLPETASAEQYDNIFRSIAIHLLGRDEE